MRRKISNLFYSIQQIDILNSKEIRHYNFHKKKIVTTISFLPEKKPVKILLTSGASCPDAVVEAVIKKLVSFFKGAKLIEDVMKEFA